MMTLIRAFVLIFNLKLAGALLLLYGSGQERLVLRVDGLEGYAFVDGIEPRLSWAPCSYLEGVEGWVLTLSRVDRVERVREWFVPVDHGPWYIIRGETLPPRSRYEWMVKPVLKGGDMGEAAFSCFEVGLRSDGDWNAHWVGLDSAIRGRSAPLFRKEFFVEKPVASARLYVAGLGWHEPYLNGMKLGDAVLEPVQTDYESRVFYSVHCVESFLSPGENVLGVWVGDGWYNQDLVWGDSGKSYGDPCFIAQLELVYDDGTTHEVISDESWFGRPSPVLSSNVYHGEVFDARDFDLNWSDVDYLRGSSWFPVKEVEGPGGRLAPSGLEPCRTGEVFEGKVLSSLGEGTHVVDFGRNITGWARLNLRASRGTRITLRFSESVFENGEIDPAGTGVVQTKQVQTDEYTCRGGGLEVWEPRFTFHSFRYVEFSVSEGRLFSEVQESLQAVSVHTDFKDRGLFYSSEPVLQELYEIGCRTMLGNMLGVPFDCPGRERCGWTGDAHLVAPFVQLRFTSTAFWVKYCTDIVTSSQKEGDMLTFGRNFLEREVRFKEKGLPTMIAPGLRTSGAASPDWGSAIVFIPWEVYGFSGDVRILERHYKAMRQWVDHLMSIADEGIISVGLGDWCAPWLGDESPPDLRLYYGRVVPELSTACYFRCAEILSDVADILGHHEDASRYGDLAEIIRERFVESFWKSDEVGFGTLTINSIAVDWGLLDGEMAAMLAGVVSSRVLELGGRLDAGVFGQSSMFAVLGRYDKYEALAALLGNEDSPGFRYLINRGATTFWEVYPSSRDEGGSYLRSKSHPFQGAWLRWCFEGVAGIKRIPAGEGYRIFELSPEMMGRIDSVTCVLKSPMGRIESSWITLVEREEIVWSVEVPPGARARLREPYPISKIDTVEGGGLSEGWLAPGVYKIYLDLGMSEGGY